MIIWIQFTHLQPRRGFSTTHAKALRGRYPKMSEDSTVSARSSPSDERRSGTSAYKGHESKNAHDGTSLARCPDVCEGKRR